MEMLSNDKVFFNPGDICQVKHDIENKPTMYVVEKVTRTIVNKNGDKDSLFIGIKCRWFDSNKVMRESIFSTKDLQHVGE